MPSMLFSPALSATVRSETWASEKIRGEGNLPCTLNAVCPNLTHSLLHPFLLLLTYPRAKVRHAVVKWHFILLPWPTHRRYQDTSNLHLLLSKIAAAPLCSKDTCNSVPLSISASVLASVQAWATQPHEESFKIEKHSWYFTILNHPCFTPYPI